MVRAATSAKSQDRLLALSVALLVGGIGFLFARSLYDNYDGFIMGEVARNILGHHSITVAIDPLKINTPYSSYGLGMSLLMIPTLALGRLVGAGAAAGIMATNAWLLGGLAAAVYAWCRLRECTRVSAYAIALAAALGGGLLPYASTGFGEIALGLAITIGLLGITATSRGLRWGPPVTGVAAGASALIRSDSLALVVPWLVLGAILVSPKRRETATRLALAALPFAGLWAWYNAARYGAPWRLGYDVGVFVLNHSLGAGLYGQILSPGKGVLFFAPLMVVALLGWRAAWRSSRVITFVASGLVVERLLFFAVYWGWYGGGSFGPRYFLPVLPVMTLGLIELAHRGWRLRVALRPVAVALSGASLLVGVAGVAVDYEQNSQLRALARAIHPRPAQTRGRAYIALLEEPATEAAIDRRLFDWSTFPVTDEIGSLVRGRDIASAALGPSGQGSRLAITLGLLGCGGAAAAAAVRVRHRGTSGDGSRSTSA
ncbi:MAG TPA: hypothetical protein VNG13_01985 [Mycobacteriales bacterium]|nr:hypothetical protein [Mycobacteriales bacterium]